MTTLPDIPTAALSNPTDIDYRLLIEHIPAITYIAKWDTDSSTYYVSPQIEQVLGFTQEAWMADPVLWRTQIHPADRELVLDALVHLRATSVATPLEYRMLTSHGAIRWFRDEAAILRNAIGQPIALYGVMVDITHEKELEAALDDIHQQLTAARRPVLTEREVRVVGMLRQRATDHEMACTLSVSERTIRNDIKRMCTKFGVVKRKEIIQRAIVWEYLLADGDQAPRHRRSADSS